MAQTIAVLSQKGGTGKTTTVRTLTDVLRRIDVRTLAVDLDPQGNLSDYFDLPPDSEPTIADVLAGSASAKDAIHQDTIPASLNLAETELMLGGKIGREMTLRRALAKVQGEYEIVLVDCPPSLGLLTVNALVAADHALVTAEAQYFALQGVEQAMEVIEIARDSLNDELSLLGVLLNLADMRTVHSREALLSLKERFGEKVLDSVVRSSIAYAESAERATSILDHRPDLGADYVALTDELLGRLPGMAGARTRLALACRDGAGPMGNFAKASHLYGVPPATKTGNARRSAGELRGRLSALDPKALGESDHLELGDAGAVRERAGRKHASEASTREHRRAGGSVGGGEAQAIELAHALEARAEHHQVVQALGRPAAGGHRDLERRCVAHEAGLLGQVQVRSGELVLVPVAELAISGRGGGSRHLEELGEAEIVLPERFALLACERAHEPVVEPLCRVGDHGDRPQHQLRVERRVGGASWVVGSSVVGSSPTTRSCMPSTVASTRSARERVPKKTASNMPPVWVMRLNGVRLLRVCSLVPT